MTPTERSVIIMKYICETCGTIYDEEVGYTRRGIPAGTPFEKLPVFYHCPGCGCEKEAFTPVKESSEANSVRQVAAQGQYVKYPDSNGESQR